MPHLSMETPHTLGQEEATRRLKGKFSIVRDAYRGQVSDLQEVWNEHILSFSFKAVGMKVAGTVTVEDLAVKLNAELPFAAMMFKGLIEQKVREELGELLA